MKHNLLYSSLLSEEKNNHLPLGFDSIGTNLKERTYNKHTSYTIQCIGILKFQASVIQITYCKSENEYNVPNQTFTMILNFYASNIHSDSRFTLLF